MAFTSSPTLTSTPEEAETASWLLPNPKTNLNFSLFFILVNSKIIIYIVMDSSLEGHPLSLPEMIQLVKIIKQKDPHAYEKYN